MIAALTGQYTNIHAVRNLFGLDPVYTSLPLASIYAGVHGATAAVLALRERRQGRAPSAITAPLAGAAISAMSSIYLKIENQPARYEAPRLPGVIKKLALPLMRHWAKRGPTAQAKLLGIARKSYPALMTSYACKGGGLLYIFAIDNAKLVRAALKAIGVLDAVLKSGFVFQDPYKAGDSQNNLSENSNLDRGRQASMKALIAEKLATRTSEDWEALLVEAGVPCAVQRTTDDWMRLPELVEAGIVAPVDDPNHGMMLQPGVQTWLSDSPETLARPRAGYFPAKLPEIILPEQDPADTKFSSRPPAQWLEGLTVIDLCSMVAGPVAGRTLAEYGARVIKVETPTPNHGPRMTCWYGIDGNQGKDSVLLDLKTKAGQHAIKVLLSNADILLTNHMPDAMERMGLGEDHVRAIKPDLVYACIGAYNGPLGGPWNSRNGYDPVLQAASGIMMRYGDPGHPEIHAIASCVDALTGYSAAFGMALALLRRDEDGKGRRVDASLAASATLIQLPYAFTGVDRADSAQGQTVKGENPFYRMYQTKDGWLFLAASGAAVSELPAPFQPEEFDLNDVSLVAEIAQRVKARSLASALDLFAKAGLSATPVRTVDQLRTALLHRRSQSGLRLVQQDVDGLGPVVTAPAMQVCAQGELKQLAPTEKPGASTIRILEEFGLNSEALVEAGAAAEEISNEHLPA